MTDDGRPTDEQRRAYAEARAKALAEWGDALHILMHGEPRPAEITAARHGPGSALGSRGRRPWLGAARRGLRGCGVGRSRV